MIRQPSTAVRPAGSIRPLASLSLLVVVLLAGPAAAAGVYKWTDENGKVHYGDRPPGDDATEMSVPPPSPGGAAPTDAERRVKQRRLLEAFERERAEKKAAAKKEKQARVKRRRECVRARDQLRQYREAAYLYGYDKDGKRVIFSKERRAEATKRYADAVKKHCG